MIGDGGSEHLGLSCERDLHQFRWRGKFQRVAQRIPQHLAQTVPNRRDGQDIVFGQRERQEAGEIGRWKILDRFRDQPNQRPSRSVVIGGLTKARFCARNEEHSSGRSPALVFGRG